ncbi:MAG TPA: hypothetical protein PLQ35_17395 [bacterium]|nr:hypothetical protein [bacterium]HQL64053.1 hypothetical protein [bacterium]
MTRTVGVYADRCKMILPDRTGTAGMHGFQSAGRFFFRKAAAVRNWSRESLQKEPRE